MDKANRSLVFSYTPYKSRGYIGSLTDTKTIEIYNIIPEELGYSYSPNFTEQEVLGRMSPIQLYTGGSDKVYTFTLSVHEDMVMNLEGQDYKNIIDFVDDLKAMSYPYLDSTNNMRAQKIYFQIGEISGRGYVQVGVAWKKPFRNGRYVMADISFTITVEELLQKVEVEVGELDEEYKLDYATYYGNIRLDDRTSELITEYGNYIGYDISLVDFVASDNISLEEKQSNVAYTEKFFDSKEEKFLLMLDMMSELDVSSDIIDNLKLQVEGIGEIEFGSLSEGPDPSIFFEVSRTTSKLDKIKESLVEYVEMYYKEINTKMTEGERDAIIVDIEDTIEAMKIMYEEVYGYGKAE